MDSLDPARHLDDDALAALADGAMAPVSRAAAEAHVAGCAECRDAWLAVAEAVAMGETTPPAPAGLADRVLARLPLEAGTPPPAAAPRAREVAMLRPVPASPGERFAYAAAASLLLAATVGGAFVVGHGIGGSRPIGEETFAGLPLAAPAAPGTTVRPATPPDLGTTGRYLACLSTDKPQYRPGEKLFARAVVLDAFDRKPADGALSATFEVRSGLGAVVLRQSATTADGVAAFGWEIPADQAGGTFTLAASSESFASVETTVDVHDHRLPLIRADLDFARKAYGPGDVVTATLDAERAEGGLPAGASVTAVATVDGAEVARTEATLDGAGRCTVSFALPKEIAAGDGTLAATIVDGGVTETTAKTIPIVVARVALSLYPEGGDLVADVPNRVYFEAKTPKQKPADVAGRVLDEKGAVMARLRSEHEGRGRFDLSPKAGVAYRVVLDEPAGVPTEYALPAVAPTGFALASLSEGAAVGEPIRVAVSSPLATSASVGLYVRERELDLKTVRVPAGKPVVVTLFPRSAASGVLRATVFDAEGLPRAERLVLRRPSDRVAVTLRPSVKRVAPGSKVSVDVTTTDAWGRPVAAVVGLSASDEQALTLPEPRERPARLPVSALLGAEVSELKDPTAYLGDDPASARKADLLLGTQGWRRFAFFAVSPEVSPVPGASVAEWEAWGTRISRVVGFRLFQWDDEEDEPMPGGDLSGFSIPRVALTWRAGSRPFVRTFASTISPIDFNTGRAAPSSTDGFLLVVTGQGQATNANWNGLNRVVYGGRIRRGAGRGADGSGTYRYWESGPDFTRIGGNGGAGGGFVDLSAARDIRIFGLLDARGGKASVWSWLRARGSYFPLAPAGVTAPAWVRVFAHEAAKGKAEEERSDFTETVYWNAALVTGADGKGSFEFDASDSVTTLHVTADALSKAGALGLGDAKVEVRRPFHLEPRLPLEVTAGDRIEVPVALVNGTENGVTARLDAEAGEGLKVAGGDGVSVDVPADGSVRASVLLDVEKHRGAVKVRLRAEAGTPSDEVVREVKVVPAGFPFEVAAGGVLVGTVEREVEIPADAVADSLEAEAVAYPSPLASFSQAVASLLQEPSGCFEQTSSTNYPNVMALRYLKAHPDADPKAVEQAKALAEKGYRRLVSFECAKRGYEWFGHDPAHEALTAYGLLEFADMTSVTEVDAGMVARTRAWLLSRRDGKGGFEQGNGSHSFGRAPAEVTDAYVAWALARAGEKDLAPELARATEIAKASRDPYVLALCAHVLLGTGEREAGTACLEALAARQDASGAVTGAKTSITSSGGESLVVETTSLAVLAWLRSERHAGNAERAMAWIASVCRGGRFGSTQATVLALDAIAAYDAAHARTTAAGSIALSVDGKAAGKVDFPAGHKGTVALPAFAPRLSGGKHVVRLSLEGGTAMPFGIVVRGHRRTPPSSPRANVAITTALAKTDVVEGDPVDVSVSVENETDGVLPMVVAIVGLPGGLEPRVEALKELVKSGRVDAWEVRGREVVLYWTGMEAKGANRVPISCLAAVPGSYTGPASRAYLYYTDEDKAWVPPLSVRIAAPAVR
jgi:hypothetical protein